MGSGGRRQQRFQRPCRLLDPQCHGECVQSREKQVQQGKTKRGKRKVVGGDTRVSFEVHPIDELTQVEQQNHFTDRLQELQDKLHSIREGHVPVAMQESSKQPRRRHVCKARAIRIVSVPLSILTITYDDAGTRGNRWVAPP